MNTQAKTLSRGEVLKQRRAQNAAAVERAQALLREQRRIQQEISRLLAEQPQTVPEVAAALGIPAAQALWYLAAMKKYNLVVENGMRGDYPLYQMAKEQ